jgi:hypothetical protein
MNTDRFVERSISSLIVGLAILAAAITFAAPAPAQTPKRGGVLNAMLQEKRAQARGGHPAQAGVGRRAPHAHLAHGILHPMAPRA